MPQVIVTAVGPDRPGLVAELTQRVHKAGANLADSRMVNLRGHFALLALVEGSADALGAVRAALADEAGLRLEVDVVDAASPSAPAQGSVPYRLKTYSMDQPGIVARVTEVLLRHGVNVEDLQTRLESAPFAGTPLFTIEAVVSVPATASLRKLRDELEALGEAIGCDVDIDRA